MTKSMHIALVAHDQRKPDLAQWVRKHAEKLKPHTFVATGTTGSLLAEVVPELRIERLRSGPLGGDQQLGALIAENRLDMLIFFVDPMTPLPHDVDVKALTRLAILYNLPMALSRATAEYLIASPLFGTDFDRHLPDYSPYIERILENAKARIKA
ncbi:Methylglyoxal synthase [hydrothermal vent metagenome]|uniref:Methylglyoxal synthase n=1 Tax=hydrothermal vent metagenome TaxID=652676 RepID=A0A3B0SWA7_9ZZZZ